MTQLRLRDQIEKPKLALGKNGSLYLLVLVSTCLSAVSILFVFINLLYTRQITRKEFPSLVQTTSGETIEIGLEDPEYRSPETIKSFVASTLYYLMSMTSYGVGDAQISSLDPRRQKALPVKVELGNNSQGAITQTAFLASESLESNFADEFRGKLAQMTPPDVFTGVEEIILKIDYIRQPEAVNDEKDRWTGVWTVDVVGNLKVFRMSKGEIDTIPFNKRVTVRPIDTPHIHDVTQFGELAMALNASQLSGLQILDIKDLQLAE